jgi:decaprenylphospho-beta-D-ribofuranose 2-oxidase
MTRVSGWGRYPCAETEIVSCRDAASATRATAQSEGVIARGNGRAYGDAAIGTRTTLSMLALDRMRAFDPSSGLLTVEAGVLLADIIATFLPRGFFPFVVPGTRLVTIGGAIAADVHGKNHHREGGFGDHLESLLLVTGDGACVRASRTENPELFNATIGGMGLTGTILEATIRLRRVETGWIRQRTIVAGDLAAAIASLEAHDAATYSVAWIDAVARGAALGRSLVFLGEHARAGELDARAATRLFPPVRGGSVAVPVDFPAFALNSATVAAFNALYFRAGARRAGAPFLVDADTYFFPLDSIGGWNRIYGARGFVQHQCVLPPATAAAALAEILDRVSRRGNASFLAVLKKLGPASGLLSFPMPGYTLSLDFPVSRGLLLFLDEIDAVVAKAGGRIYLAKDARQSREVFAAGYPHLDRFCAMRRLADPAGRIRSRLAERLGL